MLMLESDLDLYYCCADVKGLTWSCVTNGLLHVLCRMLLVATISQPVRLSVVKPLLEGVYHHRMVPGMSWNLLEFDFNADSFRFCWGPGFSAASFEPPNCNCNESWPRFG